MCYNTSMKRYILYWAHYAHQTDIRSEGYVGITSRKLYVRKNRHRNNKASALYEIGKDKELIWQVMYENLSEHEALMIEEFLRPTDGIGYNKRKGGKCNGCNHSVRVSYTRNVTEPYKTTPFYIDDVMFVSKNEAKRWLVKNGICSARTAERRITGKDKVTLDECRRKR